MPVALLMGHCGRCRPPPRRHRRVLRRRLVLVRAAVPRVHRRNLPLSVLPTREGHLCHRRCPRRRHRRAPPAAPGEWCPRPTRPASRVATPPRAAAAPASTGVAVRPQCRLHLNAAPRPRRDPQARVPTLRCRRPLRSSPVRSMAPIALLRRPAASLPRAVALRRAGGSRGAPHRHRRRRLTWVQRRQRLAPAARRGRAP